MTTISFISTILTGRRYDTDKFNSVTAVMNKYLSKLQI